MDVDKLHSPYNRSEKLGFKPQKELIFTNLLPCAEDIQNNSLQYLAEIKANLGKSVMIREIKPGCDVWAYHLREYINIHGFKFSKEDHIHFVHLIYELLTIPNLEPFLIHQYALVLMILLRKRELISPSELVLPWRPLYEVLVRSVYNSKCAIGMNRLYASGDVEEILEGVVHAAKYYFPVSSTEEMLQTWKPMLCPWEEHIISCTMQNMEWFLPLCLPPDQSDKGYKLWFEDMMNLWEVCPNAPEWEDDLTVMLANLAYHNKGYIDWEPYIPMMFTKFLRSLDLPVAYKQMTTVKIHKIDSVIMAQWIVSVLGGGSSAQKHLDTFLRALESYVHPANHGKWTDRLTQLLSKLPYYFVERLHFERYNRSTWETPVPTSHKLTEEDITEFVKSIKPLAMKAMYSRMSTEVNESMRLLAMLRPKLIIPDLVESVYANMESVNQPHKYQVSLHCLTFVIRTMVEGSDDYPEGRTHVIPLLLSVVTGIDPNDIVKCFAVLHFISLTASLVPIVDSSKALEHYQDLTEEEKTICRATASFEDFILQFLNGCFVLIESSSMESTRMERVVARRSKLENLAESALGSACAAVLMQTSPQIFLVALKKVHSFVMGRILETKVAGPYLAEMCRVFARVNGEVTLRLFIPYLSDNILALTESEETQKEETLDNELLHYLLIISEIVDCAGKFLLPHVPVLKKVLCRTLHLSCREGFIRAARLLTVMLHSLSYVTAIERRSVPQDFGADVKDYLPIRDWGKVGSVHDLKIQWYVPGQEEIDCVQSLVSTYLPPEIERVKEFIRDDSLMSREQLECSLTIITAFLGCKILLPFCVEEPLVLVPSSVPLFTFKCWNIMEGKFVTMPDGSNVRKTLVLIMEQLQKKLLQCKEDDTKSLGSLIYIWSELMTRHSNRGTNYDARRNRYRAIKKLLEKRLVTDKKRVRAVLIERAQLQCDLLMEVSPKCITETHRVIMLNLLTLSVSQYSEIRIRAQTQLYAAMKYFPHSYVTLVPTLEEYLRNGDHDQFKGALYVLLSPISEPLIIENDWNVLRSFWLTIVRAKPSEKISVIRLLERLMNVIHKNFPTLWLEVKVPDHCVNAARMLWNSSPLPSIPLPTEDEVAVGLKELELRNQNNIKQYLSLLNSLNDAIEYGNLHWRFHSMALKFIRDLVHPDIAYPPPVVRQLLNTLIHDSLLLRKIAMRCVVFALKHQKKTHKKVSVDLYNFLDMKKPDKVFPGDRPDNQWIQYKSCNVPQNAEDWNNRHYIHLPYIGFYSWSNEVKLYAPPCEQPPLMNPANLDEGEKEVYTFFSTTSNVDKLMTFLTLEEKKGKDKFNGYRFLIFKSLFRNGGYEMFKFFLPYVDRFVHSKLENEHRCATEIIAGAVRATKHWPYEMVESLRQDLTPLIRSAISNMTEETISDWGICFATSTENRDPNRIHWFFEILNEEPPPNESSFFETGRLYALQGALNQVMWKMSDMINVWLERIKPYLFHPFQNVRERMGSVINNIFELDVNFPGAKPLPSPRVSEFIDYLLPQLSLLYIIGPEAKDSILHQEGETERGGSGDVTERHSGQAIDEEAKDNAIRLFKTVCRWIVANVTRSDCGVSPDYFRLVPLFFLMEGYEADDEVRHLCNNVLVGIGYMFHGPLNIAAAIATITKVSHSSSWQARFTCLEFLQSFVYYNLCVLLTNQQWTNEVSNVVLRLMEDEWLEVRVKAAGVLSGLLHTGFIRDYSSLLVGFKNQAAIKIVKNMDRIDPMSLRLRHTGVLGMCSFINAYPYDIPEFVPDILLVLGEHLSDPQPISTTITKTLGDFKRTHHYNWEQHSLKFTDVQLAVLGDLSIPPSYYV